MGEDVMKAEWIKYKEKFHKSFQKQTALYGMGIFLVVFLLLLTILKFSGYFSKSADEVNGLLKLQTGNVVSEISQQMNSMEAEGVRMSEELSARINQYFVEENIKFENLENNGVLIDKLEECTVGILNEYLRSGKTTGAFMVLDTTCNTETSKEDRASVYLRRADLNGNNLQDKTVYMFRGSAKVGRKEKIKIHNRWDLEFDTSYVPGYEALIEAPVKRLASSGRWSKTLNLKGTWEDVMILCVPILNRDGKTIGICGFEVSELYFQFCYPTIGSNYGDMGVLLASSTKNKICSQNALAGVVLENLEKKEQDLVVKKGKYYNTYKGKYDEFIGLHRKLPTRTMEGKTLTVAVLMSANDYREVAADKRGSRLFVVIVTALVITLLIILWLEHFMRPWQNLMEKIRKGEQIEGQSFNNEDIDKLLDYFAEKKKQKMAQNMPPEIEDLMQNFVERVQGLTPMERTVFQYYIDGYNLEDVSKLSFISLNTAKKHNTNINRKLGVSNKEELLLYIDIFRRCGMLGEIEKK